MADEGTSRGAPADSERTEDLAGSVPEDRLPEPHQRPVATEPGRGRTIGKYQLIATLGRGGMADVHLAVSMGPAGFSKLQVIKCLRASLADEPELRDMLLDEARLAARLNHRNVVQTNEVGIEGAEHYLAMEYLEGQPLSRVLTRARERDEPIPLAVALWILSEALAGLHYAHELTDYDGSPLGVVHRDVSPHNIFVTYDGQVKVVDFGIAVAARRSVETQTGTLKGKVAYMAPEQAFGTSADIDRRADVFAVGVMLWELAAGRRLWRGLGDAQIISRLMRDIPDVRSARPEVPFELSRIIGRALARDREARYASAAELRAELERYLERLGEQVTAAQAGQIVARLFEQERAEIKALVERQLRNLERAAREGADWSGSGRRASLPPIDESAADEEPTAPAGGAPRSLPPPAAVPAAAPGQETPLTTVRPSAEDGRGLGPRALLIVAAAAIGAGSLVLFLGWPAGAPGSASGSAPAPAPASAPASAPAAAPASASAPAPADPAAVPAGRYIRVRIAANPTEAKLLVDGSELPSNPFESRFVRDDAAHRIEARANGFQAQSRLLVFDRDHEVDFTLFPVARPAGAAPSAAPEPEPGAPPPKPDPY